MQIKFKIWAVFMRFTQSDFMTSCAHDNHKKNPPSVEVHLSERCSAFITIYEVSLLLFRNKPYLMFLMQNIGCFTTSFNQLFLTMWPEKNKSVFQEWGEKEKAQHKHKYISWGASRRLKIKQHWCFNRSLRFQLSMHFHCIIIILHPHNTVPARYIYANELSDDWLIS